MSDKPRYLITTADERTWKFDCPVLFLGEWCRLYERKQVWEGMDARIAEPYGLQDGQKERDLAYVHELSGRLLYELTDALNGFHNTCHSVRYWQIVLGHWLQRYVAVTFNRYATLEQALKNHEVSGTRMFDFTGYSLATTGSMAFIRACSDDVWNHVLYGNILNFWGNVKTEIDSVSFQGISGFVQEGNNKVARRHSAKRFIVNAAKFMLPKLSKRRDAFIINSFLPLIEEIKLQLSLGQFPQLWDSPQLKPVAPDPDQRQHFSIDAERYEGFERYIRVQLAEMIPTCYLEGYNQLVKQVESLPWPTEPRFIFTSNNFDTDEIFKVWTGSKAEKGIPYFTGQHGSNYGTHVYFGNHYWPERAATDAFFTWGWTDGDPKEIPAFIFKTAGRKSQCWTSDGGLLLVELHPPHLFGPEDSYFEFGIYQEEQFRFVAALPETILQKVTVRLHHAYRDFRWSDEQRWKDRSPHTQIEAGVAPIQRLIAQSRLVVHSYDSSGILENLALNVPTMCFWHGGLGHLLSNAKPYYELLRQAGILLDSPEMAANKVSEVWGHVPAWWESDEIQTARRKFCDRYARVSEHPISELKTILSVNKTR